MAQWYSTYLASVRLLVQTPVPPEKVSKESHILTTQEKCPLNLFSV
jgi:hypothetical protein